MTPYYYTLDKQSYDTAYPDFYNLQQLQTGDEYIQESYSEPWTEQTFYSMHALCTIAVSDVIP